MKEASPTPRFDSGFSLIEVLVAVALLAVILLALFSLISMGVQRAYSGKKLTQATMIAQAALERANVYEAHERLGAGTGVSTVSQTWTRTKSSTLPVAVGTTTPEGIDRDAWRSLLETADLPVSDDQSATLTVSITAVPAGKTFADATMERIVIDLSWYEWKRRRQVRLQTLNLRVTP